MSDPEVEADEMYQNAGEKGIPHLDPNDPPRRRANKQRGHGTFENDRPPIAGIIGRQTGAAELEVVWNSTSKILVAFVERTIEPDATAYTDEWRAYDALSQTGRIHKTVCHAPATREWARDDDGDGRREVHVNTMEGFWTGLRDFLRTFRGVSKWYLDQYVAVYKAIHNWKDSAVALLAFVFAETG